MVRIVMITVTLITGESQPNEPFQAKNKLFEYIMYRYYSKDEVSVHMKLSRNRHYADGSQPNLPSELWKTSQQLIAGALGASFAMQSPTSHFMHSNEAFLPQPSRAHLRRSPRPFCGIGFTGLRQHPRGMATVKANFCRD